jgi:hydrogenase expression/formation protein HypD
MWGKPRFGSEFRDPEVAKLLADSIRARLGRPLAFMEVCGTHTVSIFRHGLRSMLPARVRLLSGPGCPVCVTPNVEIDKAIALARTENVKLVTFGDMMKVPGSYSSLAEVRGEGADVVVAYSTIDAIEMARQNPKMSVVFFGIGFETTAPTVAASVLQAEELGLKNYFVVSAHKTMPRAMKALLDSGDIRLDGFLCPGHVSTIIGAEPYEFITREYGLPCVIAGFEPVDVLKAIDMLVEQADSGRASVQVQYSRAVRWRGNESALEMMYRVFEPCDSEWRGLGSIPDSGLRLRSRYRWFDAVEQFKIEVPMPREPKGCLCGDVLRGVKSPPDCQLFRGACTPEHPVGPCMVSSEGTCSAWYVYGLDGCAEVQEV